MMAAPAPQKRKRSRKKKEKAKRKIHHRSRQEKSKNRSPTVPPLCPHREEHPAMGAETAGTWPTLEPEGTSAELDEHRAHRSDSPPRKSSRKSSSGDSSNSPSSSSLSESQPSGAEDAQAAEAPSSQPQSGLRSAEVQWPCAVIERAKANGRTPWAEAQLIKSQPETTAKAKPIQAMTKAKGKAKAEAAGKAQGPQGFAGVPGGIRTGSGRHHCPVPRPLGHVPCRGCPLRQRRA